MRLPSGTNCAAARSSAALNEPRRRLPGSPTMFAMECLVCGFVRGSPSYGGVCGERGCWVVRCSRLPPLPPLLQSVRRLCRRLLSPPRSHASQHAVAPDQAVEQRRRQVQQERGEQQQREPVVRASQPGEQGRRSEEHTSELQSLMRISYAVFCLKKKKQQETKK